MLLRINGFVKAVAQCLFDSKVTRQSPIRLDQILELRLSVLVTVKSTCLQFIVEKHINNEH